jgi:hypothetical protein
MRATGSKFGRKLNPLEVKNRLEEQSFVEEGSPWLQAGECASLLQGSYYILSIQPLDEEVPQLASPETAQINPRSDTSLPVTSIMGYILEFLFSQLLKAVTLGLLVVSFNWNGSLFGVKSRDGDLDVVLSQLGQLQRAIHSQRLENSATTFPTSASSYAELILMQDFTLINSGGFPIPPLTSMFATAPSSWHLWRQAQDQHTSEYNSAHYALTAGESCWRIPRTRGHLGIGFRLPVIITHISIEHLPSWPMDAPREVVLWGFLEQVDNLQHYTAVDPNVDDRPPQEVVEESQKQNPTGSFIKLAHVEYSPFHDSHIQTFPVRENVLRSGFDFGLVVIEIRGNWGADETCLYRVRVHGTDVDTKVYY